MVVAVPARSVAEWREDAGAGTTDRGVAVAESASGCITRRESRGKQSNRALVAATGIGSQRRASVSSVPHADVHFLAERIAGAGAVLHGDVRTAGSVYQGDDATADRPGEAHCTNHFHFGYAVFEVSHNRRSGA